MRQADILSLLPRVIQRSVQPSDPLDALLATMEGLHASTEQTIVGANTLTRPWQAPEALLPYLASWLDLDAVLSPDARGVWQLPTGEAQLRTLLDAAVDIARWRGTRRGMLLYLEAATGLAGYEIQETVRDDRGAVLPFTIQVIGPAAAAALAPLIARIVEVAKPAYVQARITFAEGSATDDPAAEPTAPSPAPSGGAGQEPPWLGQSGPPSSAPVPPLIPAPLVPPPPVPPTAEPPSPGAPHA